MIAETEEFEIEEIFQKLEDRERDEKIRKI